MNVSSEYFGVSVRMPLQKEKYFENYVSHTCIFPLSTMLLQHTSLKKIYGSQPIRPIGFTHVWET